jgi:signal transduction histidine kinase
VAFTASPIREGGRTVGTIIEVRDISPERAREAEMARLLEAERAARGDREQLLSALELERSRLEAVFAQTPSVLAIVRGPQHVLTMANQAYIALNGYRDVIGKPLLDAVPELQGQGFDKLLDAVVETGVPYVGREIPIWLSTSAGAPPEERFFDFVYLPLVEPDEQGTPVRVGVIAHGNDITEQVVARREVERARAEAEAAREVAESAREAAEAAARAKAEFLATMSHEIRTPINAIVGYTQLLELGLPDRVTPSQRQQLGRIAASAQHLLGLVNDVLDVAKVDAAEMRVAQDPAIAQVAIAEALALVRPLAAERSIRLTLPEEQGPISYVGDAARVRQILVNLLSNAVKFTLAGGSVTIRTGFVDQVPPQVHSDTLGPWVYISVADSGVGIAPDQQADIFDPFVQVVSGHTRTAGGTGLGLTISRRLARLMKGDLTVESEPGVGSTFTLWLPAAASDSIPDGQVGVEGDRPSGPWRVHGLADIGRALREQTDAILEGLVARLRVDPEVPHAAHMPQAQLEDHALTLISDLAQSLVIVDDAGDEAAGLMADGSAIQRTIAELHGARRRAQGWSEHALSREYDVLRETIENAVRGRIGAMGGEVTEGIHVLGRLQDRVKALAVVAYQHAGSHTKP